MAMQDLPPIEHGVRIWCEVCDQHQPFEVESARQTTPHPRHQGGPYWGDIVCAVCHFVIGTYTSDHEGPHELRPVARA